METVFAAAPGLTAIILSEKDDRIVQRREPILAWRYIDGYCYPVFRLPLLEEEKALLEIDGKFRDLGACFLVEYADLEEAGDTFGFQVGFRRLQLEFSDGRSYG